MKDSINFSDSVEKFLQYVTEKEPNKYFSDSITNNLSELEIESGKSILGLDYSLAQIIIPVVVTLSVFLIGQFISWLKKRYERLNELKSIKTTIEQWILLVKPSIQNQIDGCKSFAIVLKNSKNIHPESLKFSPMLIDKLKQFELRELIDTIIVNLEGDNEIKAKIVFNFVSQVEFLSKMEDHIKNNYEKFHTYTFELMENWNQSFTRMTTIMNETSRQISHFEPNCKFLTQRNIICNNFLKHKSLQPLDVIFSELITPLEQEVNEYLEKSGNKHLIVDLAYSIEELKLIRDKWELHKNGHSELVDEFGSRILNVYAVLEDVANQLKESKFKTIWNIK